MTIFKEIEKRLENLFEGFFNSQFRSSLQPIELARKLAAEMDRKRQVSVAHTYVPNTFKVRLASDDFSEIEGFKESLVNELIGYLTAYTKDKNYHLTGALEISLESDAGLKSGECRVFGRVEEDESEPTSDSTQIISAEEAKLLIEASARAWLYNQEAKLNFPLTAPVVSIGRLKDNDIVLNSAGVSRHHARLEKAQIGYRVIDLDSTNGTLVNGKEVSQTFLVDGDVIEFGDVNLTLRLK